jgi:hypothetical protein
MHFARYEEAPRHVADEIIAKTQGKAAPGNFRALSVWNIRVGVFAAG